MRNPSKIIFLIFFNTFQFAPYWGLNTGFAEPQKEVIVGHISTVLSAGVGQKDATAALEMLSKRITEEFSDYNISKNIIFPDMESAAQASEEGKVDILTLPSISYLKVRNRINMKPAFLPSKGEKPGDKYVLLVHKKKSYKTLAQLQKNKIIIKRDHSGIIAMMWIDTLLLEQSLPENTYFFSNIKKVDKGSHAVLPVFFGQADACIVHSRTFETMIELNPQVKKQITILLESPKLIDTITCIRKGIDKGLEKMIFKLGDKVNKDPAGQQLLMIFKMKKNFPYSPKHLINIEKLYEKYKALKVNGFSPL